MFLPSLTETHKQYYLVLSLLSPCDHSNISLLSECVLQGSHAENAACVPLCLTWSLDASRCKLSVIHVPPLTIRWTWAVSFFSYQGRWLPRTFVYKYLSNSCFQVGLVGSIQQRLLDYIIFCWLWGITILTVPLYFHKKCLRVSLCLCILICLHFIFL